MSKTVTVNGQTYHPTSPKEFNKLVTIEKMINDHKKGMSLETIVEKYGYNSEFYVKRHFKNVGYFEAHSDRYLKNRNLGRKMREDETDRSIHWGNILSRGLV